jgi:hypothetical protein
MITMAYRDESRLQLRYQARDARFRGNDNPRSLRHRLVPSENTTCGVFSRQGNTGSESFAQAALFHESIKRQSAALPLSVSGPPDDHVPALDHAPDRVHHARVALQESEVGLLNLLWNDRPRLEGLSACGRDVERDHGPASHPRRGPTLWGGVGPGPGSLC